MTQESDPQTTEQDREQVCPDIPKALDCLFVFYTVNINDTFCVIFKIYKKNVYFKSNLFSKMTKAKQVCPYILRNVVSPTL